MLSEGYLCLSVVVVDDDDGDDAALVRPLKSLVELLAPPPGDTRRVYLRFFSPFRRRWRHYARGESDRRIKGRSEDAEP